jgi:hypothetical protein
MWIRGPAGGFAGPTPIEDWNAIRGVTTTGATTGVLIGALAGAITGGVLAWLLHDPVAGVP